MANASILKEYPLNRNVLKSIPEKVYFTFTSAPVHITCFDVSSTHILLGTDTGCAFLHNRETGHVIKVLCQNRQDYVSSVKLLAGLQCQVAIGTREGGITITVFTSTFAGSKQVQKFKLGEVHKSEVCCLVWSTNGMKLFSADRLGDIYVADVDLNLNVCSSSFVLNQDCEVVEMEYRHKVLLVSTIEQSFLYINQEIRMIGSKPLRKGRYGSCFNTNTSHQDELQVFASRPGLRIWISNLDGNVVSTLKMKELIKSSSCTIPLDGINATSDKDSMFGRLHVFGSDCIVAHHDSSIYVINHKEGTIVGEVHNLNEVIQVGVNEMEILVLCRDRILHRIAYESDKSAKSFNSLEDDDERKENIKFNEMKETLSGIKKKVFTPFHSKMTSLTMDDVSNKIQIQARDLKRKVASIPIPDVTELRLFTDHKFNSNKTTNKDDDDDVITSTGSSPETDAIVGNVLEDLIDLIEVEESNNRSRYKSEINHADEDDETDDVKFFRIETVDVNTTQNDIVFSSKLRRRKHHKSSGSPDLSTKAEPQHHDLHHHDAPRTNEETSSDETPLTLPIPSSDSQSRSDDDGELTLSDLTDVVGSSGVNMILEEENEELNSDDDCLLSRNLNHMIKYNERVTQDSYSDSCVTNFIEEEEQKKKPSKSSTSNEQSTDAPPCKSSTSNEQSTDAPPCKSSTSNEQSTDAPPTQVNNIDTLLHQRVDSDVLTSDDGELTVSKFDVGNNDSDKMQGCVGGSLLNEDTLFAQPDLGFDIYETDGGRDFSSEEEDSSDESKETEEIPSTSECAPPIEQTNGGAQTDVDVCDDKYFEVRINSALYGNVSMKSADTWIVVDPPSSASSHTLSGSSDMICCVDNKHCVCCTEEGYEASYHLVWNKISGKATQIAVSPSGDFAWMVSKDGTVFAAPIPVKLTEDSSHSTKIHLNWRSVSENVSYVCLGATSGWLVDVNGHLLMQNDLSRSHPHGQLFESVDTKVFNRPSSVNPMKVEVLSLTLDVVWILSSEGHLYCKPITNISASIGWMEVDLPQISGKDRSLKFLTSDYVSTMWVVDVHGDLWFRSKVTEKSPKGHHWWRVCMNEYLHQSKHLPFRLSQAVARLDKANVWIADPVSVVSMVVASQSVWVSTTQHKIYITRSPIIGSDWRFSAISGVALSTRWSHITSSSIFSPEAGGWNDFIWVAQSSGELICFIAHSENTRVVAVAPPAVDGSSLISLSASRQALWVVFESGEVYVRSGISPATPAGSEWNKVNTSIQLGTTKLVHVNCGTNCVWAVDKDGGVYVRMGVTVARNHDTMAPVWLPMGPCQLSGSKFIQVTCGPSDINVWALDNQGNSHVRVGVTSELPVGKSWKVVPGPHVNQVVISNHTVWGLAEDGGVLRRCGIDQNDCEGDYWMRMPGSLKMLTVTPSDQLWAIDGVEKLRHHVTQLYYPPLLGAMRDDVDFDDMTYDDATPNSTNSNDDTHIKGLDPSWEFV